MKMKVLVNKLWRFSWWQLMSIKSILGPCTSCVHKVDPSQSVVYTIKCTKRGCSWTNWNVPLIQTVGSLWAPGLFTRGHFTITGDQFWLSVLVIQSTACKERDWVAIDVLQCTKREEPGSKCPRLSPLKMELQVAVSHRCWEMNLGPPQRCIHF